MLFSRIIAVLFITASFLFTTTTKAIGEPPAYTLDALFRMALGYSEQVKLAEEAVYMAEQDKERALSVLIPRVSAFGDYLHYSEKKIVEGIPVQPDWASTYGIRLDQSFTLNGKELIALEISKDIIQKERLDLATNRETLLIRVAEGYFNVLKAEKAVEIAEANVKRLETYKEAVQTRLKLGAVTKTDLFRASAELSGAVSDRIRAINLLVFAKSILTRLTGLSGPYRLEAPDHSSGEISDFDLPTLKQEAFQRRSDLNALRMDKVVAENEVRFTKSAWWPQIGIEGVWARPEASPDVLAPIENRLWAGINLRFSLYDGGLRRADLNQSLSKERQAELGITALKKQIALEVDEAYLNFITRKNTITALTDQLTFSEENLKAVVRQFEFGLANSIDVVDANTLLVTSERRLAEAVLESQLALLTIERTTGRLLKNVENRLDLPIENRQPAPRSDIHGD